MSLAIGTSFTALEDFWSDETQSQYCVGLRYTIGTEILAGLVQQWLEQDKVKIGGGNAEMAGTG